MQKSQQSMCSNRSAQSLTVIHGLTHSLTFAWHQLIMRYHCQQLERVTFYHSVFHSSKPGSSGPGDATVKLDTV